MSPIMPLLISTLTILLHKECNCYSVHQWDNYSVIYPLLKEWSMLEKRSTGITIVFDNYRNDIDFYVSTEMFEHFHSTTTVMTLNHLISIDSKANGMDFQLVKSGSCVILLSNDISSIRRILKSPHLWSFWNPENFYILRELDQKYTDPYDKGQERFLEWALERLWRLRRIYKIVVSIGDKFISYDPFKYENHSEDPVQRVSNGSFRKVEALDTILRIADHREADTYRYYDDYRQTFNGYPIKVSIFATPTMPRYRKRFGGMDFKYLEEVCRMMNVTPVYLENELMYGWFENGLFYGSLGDIVYKHADVSFNQFFIKDYGSKQIELGVPITSDKLCVLVPKALLIPQQVLIAHTFAPTTWLFIAFAYLTLSIVYTSVKWEYVDSYAHNGKSTTAMDSNEVASVKEKTGLSRPQELILTCNASLLAPDKLNSDIETVISINSSQESTMKNVYGFEARSNILYLSGKPQQVRSRGFKAFYVAGLLMLGKYLTKVILRVMQPPQPARSLLSERLLLMCSLITSLIINGIFTSELTSLFSRMAYLRNLETLEDVDFSGLAMLTESRDLMDDALTDNGSRVLKNLRAKLEVANDTIVNERLFKKRNAGYLQRKGIMALRFAKNQRDKIHTVEQCPREYNTAHLITKGSPFLQRIKTLVGRLNNGGFYDKWLSDMSIEVKLDSMEDEQEEVRLQLNMKHFFIPFTILFFGLSISTAIFIFERRQTTIFID